MYRRSIIVLQTLLALCLHYYQLQAQNANVHAMQKTAYYNRLMADSTSLKGKGFKEFSRYMWFQNSRADKNGSLNTYVNSLNSYHNNNLNSSNSAKSATGMEKLRNWKFLGPIGFPRTVGSGPSSSVGKGMINCIYVNPQDHNIIYAGAHRGGIWKTIDGGDSWIPLTKDIAGITGIADIKGDTSNPNVVYAATRLGKNVNYMYSNGIYKTVDGGINWTPKNTVYNMKGEEITFYPSSNALRQPKKIVMDPLKPETLYLVTYAYVLKSTDGGDTWNIIYQDNEILSLKSPLWDSWGVKSGFWDLIILTRNDKKVIYLGGYKLMRSNDEDAAWVNLTENFKKSIQHASGERIIPQRIEIDHHPNYPEKIWFLSWYPLNDTTGFDYNGKPRIRTTNVSYITKTENAFADHPTFSAVDNSRIENFGSHFCFNIKVSPNNEDVVYIAQQSIKKFDGQEYSLIHCNSEKYSPAHNYIACSGSADPNDKNWIHPDIRDMKIFSMENEDVIFTADDGGVTKSTLTKEQGYWEWKNISDDGTCGLYVTEFYGIAGIESDPGLLIGGCQDLSNFIYDNGEWIHAGNGDGGRALINPQNPDIMYVSSNYALVRYNNKGTNEDRILLGSKSFISPALEMAPNDTDVIYFGGERLYKIANANDVNVNIDITPDSFKGQVSAFDVSKSDPNVMYVFSNSVNWYNEDLKSFIFRSNDEGNNWKDITNNFTPYQYSYVTSVEISPENPNELWIGLSFGGNDVDKVYYSNSGGDTWVPLSNNFPNYMGINDLEYDSENHVLYAATDVGIFLWDDILKVWKDFSKNLPKGIVSDIEINQTAKLIRATVFGYGLWECNLGYCPIEHINKNQNGTAQKNLKISTAGAITSSQNTNSFKVIYESDKEIVLSTGFTAKSGFTANITNSQWCNSFIDFVEFGTCTNVENSKNKEDYYKFDFTENEANVYPNPSSGKITVDLQKVPSVGHKIIITSILGKIVLADNLSSHSTEFDLSHMPKGIYNLCIETNTKRINKKILITY